MKDEEIEKQLSQINKRLEKTEREFQSFVGSLNSIEVAGGIITSSGDADLDPNLKAVIYLNTRLVRIERKLNRLGDRIERLETMML
mgnify:CR=1 FL=1